MFMLAFSPRFYPGRGNYSSTSMLFASWLVAIVILTSYTFMLQVGGLPDISFDRIFLVLLLANVTHRALKHDLVHGQNKLVEVLMLVFCVICLISMTRFGFFEIYSEFARPSFIFLSGYLIPFMAFVVAKYFLSGEEDILLVFKVFFWFGCYLVLIAFLERFDLRNFVFPPYIVDPAISALHLDRSRGPFLNSAFNGLALNFAFICGMLVLPTVKGAMQKVHVLLLLSYFPAIYFTRTRSVYLHFLVTLAAIAILYRAKSAWKRLIPPIMALAVVFVVANLDTLTSANREAGGIGEMTEIYVRLELAAKSRNLLFEHPFGGIGLAQFRTGSLFLPSELQFQHNHLIGMAVELGLPGVGIYLAILLVIFRRLCKLADTIPEGQFLNLNFVVLMMAGLFITLINNVFVEPTLHLFAGVNFFALAGIVDQLYNRFALRPRALYPTADSPERSAR